MRIPTPAANQSLSSSAFPLEAASTGNDLSTLSPDDRRKKFYLRLTSSKRIHQTDIFKDMDKDMDRDAIQKVNSLYLLSRNPLCKLKQWLRQWLTTDPQHKDRKKDDDDPLEANKVFQWLDKFLRRISLWNLTAIHESRARSGSLKFVNL